MTVSALIPARLNSSRLEKKLIKDLDGIPIIVRTYKNIVSTNLFKEVIVITDADEIVEILKKHNIKFLKSLKSHNTGTDRIAEFADKFNSDIIVNVQGDEPFISKDDIISIIDEIKCDSNNLVNVVSLMIKLSNIDEINNPNNVKVVVDNNNDSILFSRSIIPFDRDDLKPNYYNEKYLIKDKDGKIIKKSENLSLLIDRTSWNRLKLVR